jgi:ADP-heptose:LPS heptosyltransferase
MRKRVLVVRADNLGDVLLTGPAVRAVHASGAEVVMMCSPAGASVAERLPGVAHVVVARLPWIDAEPEPVERSTIESLVQSVQRTGCTEAMICTSFHQTPLATALILRMAGVERIGAISPDYPGSLLDVRHTVDDDVHEVERALSLAKAMGYGLHPDDDGALQILHAPTRTPAGFVVVHPGASVPARTWAPARWQALVARLTRCGVPVVVTGGRTERSLTNLVAGDHPLAHDRGGSTRLDDLLEILAHADVVVAGNTGPAHLAAAVGTPVVSIFPPTVPAQRWRPWRVPHILLGDQDVSCAGCRARQCPRHDHRCIARIDTEHVIEAIDALRSTAPLTRIPS